MFKAILLNAVLFSFFSSMYTSPGCRRPFPLCLASPSPRPGAASGLHLAESGGRTGGATEHQGAEGGERDALGLFKASLWSELECVCMIFS